jgi:undecaprenyl-diphosphatase
MGIVQGLSEFLPISSSAHLVFAGNFFRIPEGSEVIFLDIMLHLGTLAAVFIFFWNDIFKIVKAVLKGDFSAPDAKTGLYIMLGTVITVALAFPLEKFAQRLVFNPAIVGVLLVITGVMLLVSEQISKRQASKPLSLKTSIWIALAQGLAVLPGFSRSGWTIAAGLFTGMTRVEAARYSFLLSIPIILGASMFYPLIKIDLHEAMQFNWTAIAVGTAASGITGYLCIKYFIKFVSKFSLAFFGYYCLIAGVLAALYFG